MAEHSTTMRAEGWGRFWILALVLFGLAAAFGDVPYLLWRFATTQVRWP